MCRGGDDKNEGEEEKKKDKREKEKETDNANSMSDSDSEEDIVFFDGTYTGNDEKDDFFVIVDSDSESEESDVSFNDEDKSIEEEEEEEEDDDDDDDDDDVDDDDEKDEPKTPKIEPPEENNDDNDDDDDDAVVFQANTTEYLEGFEYINYDEDTITRASTSTFLSPTKEGSNNNDDEEKEKEKEKEKDNILDNFTDEESEAPTIYNNNDSNGDDDEDEDIVFYNYDYFDEEEEEEDVSESGWKFFTEDSDDENSPRVEYASTTQIESSSNEAQTSDTKSAIRSQQQEQQQEESDIDDDEVAFTEEVNETSSNSSLFRAARAIKSALRGDQHLVRRDRELTYLREYLTACRFADMPGCFYVSGPPGTGKTTAVRRVVSGLSAAAPGNWATVCVDCIQLSKGGASELFRTIATQLGLHNTSTSTSQKAVEERLCSRELPPVAMIVDEADALFSRARRRLLFTIFTFPLLRGSRCIVIAVANASRPPASFWKKLRSRIGIWRVHFGPYSAEDLEAIVNARIESIPQHDDVVDRVAVHSIAVRLAVTCGDARRMLMLTRAAIDNALGRLSQGYSNATAAGGGALVEKVDVDTAIDEMLMADARTAGIATLPPHLAVLLAVIVRKCSIFGVQLDSEVAGSAAAAAHPLSGRGCGWANVGEVMRDADQAWARFKTQNAPGDSLQEFVLALTLLQQTGLVRVMSESRRGRTPPEMWKVQATIDQETLLSSFKDENASSLILN